VLVATDIAARGIDVTGIELVVNIDLPASPDDYIHRIGRTARAGREGHAISFATPDQGRDLRAIERLLQKRLPVSRLPDLPPAPKSEYREHRPYAGPTARPHGRPSHHQRRRRPVNRFRGRWN
jgi:ATP-dependent RNA helicase RhlE